MYNIYRYSKLNMSHIQRPICRNIHMSHIVNEYLYLCMDT